MWRSNPGRDGRLDFLRARLGSGRVGTAEMAKLRRLARHVARTRPNASFLLIGQTDASGSIRRNRHLGLQRAMAARSLLVNRFRIAYHRLATGSSERLASPEDPLASENRRVRLIRLSGS